MLVIGGGIIGLEMATVYSTLGARLDVVEMLDGLMPGADRDLVKPSGRSVNEQRFDQIMLEDARSTAVEAQADGSAVTLRGRAGAGRAAALRPRAGGGRPRAERQARSAPSKAGVAVDERGFIPVDTQMRTNVPHIFAIGDIVGQPMLAHKAVHEGHVAAEVAAGAEALFDARVDSRRSPTPIPRSPGSA